MKIVFSIFLLLTGLSVTGQSIAEIRNEFHQVVLRPEDSKNFHEYVQRVEDSNPTILAYQAVSEALLAQVVWNPFSKLSQVMKYDKEIEQAVLLDPHNIEIRFLRLAIEYNLPSFLGMSTHIKEDVKVIVENLESVKEIRIDPSYGHYIFHFLETTQLCDNSQLLAMKESLSGQAF